VKIYSRPGNELTHRFPLLVEALARLRARSCIIDGEAVACGEDGIALFERIRYRRHDESVFMWAKRHGEDLHGKFYDFARWGRDLAAGGLYRISLDGQGVVFKIDPSAKPGNTPIVGRLLRFGSSR
jgi:ATP dependent DNA ligase domain